MTDCGSAYCCLCANPAHGADVLCEMHQKLARANALDAEQQLRVYERRRHLRALKGWY